MVTKSWCAVLYSSSNFGSAHSDTGVFLVLSPCVILWIHHPLSTLKLGWFVFWWFVCGSFGDLVVPLCVDDWIDVGVCFWYTSLSAPLSPFEFTIHSQLWNWVGLCFGDLCVSFLVTWLFVCVSVAGLIEQLVFPSEGLLCLWILFRWFGYDFAVVGW